MLLAIDIGNTNVTLGLFDGKNLLREWRLQSDCGRTSDDYGAAISALVRRELGLRSRVRGLAYATVVPPLGPVFERMSRAYFRTAPMAVTSESKLGLRLRVDQPAEVGIDRILNALAARRLCKGPAVVIDFGTATTFDCVSSRGDYLGGAILIGPAVAAKALAQRTAKLPQVELRPTRRVIGKNTVECIQVGLYHGYLGMVERVLKETLKEMKLNEGKSLINVIVTGGWGGMYARALGIRKVMPDLTLQGLRIAFETLSRRSKGKNRE
ncbi:MAG: type III pantothenate kinase [Elusimicrobia bacterium]|nr:type III pantothenate kinase [Elusimicrobiota bacterium]